MENIKNFFNFAGTKVAELTTKGVGKAGDYL